jgi:hypothetical protein
MLYANLLHIDVKVWGDNELFTNEIAKLLDFFGFDTSKYIIRSFDFPVIDPSITFVIYLNHGMVYPTWIFKLDFV